MTRPLRFIHRGRTVEIADPAPTRSVLQWLREDAHCTGTKEGCAEGDCGACTVVVGELDERAPDGLRLESVNACIRFLPMLDGRALFSVEDLAAPAAEGPGRALHPVQQAMVDHHGSQCGFCTPGFVMSLWACRERHLAAGTCPSRQDLADELSGNLCRCTGYRPILDAGQALFAPDAPRARLDRAAMVQALQALRPAAGEETLATPGGWHAPRTAQALAQALAERPDARLVAGATDVGLWVTKQLRRLDRLVWTGEVAELRRIQVEPAGDATGPASLLIGAAATLEDAWTALLAHWPGVHEVWLRFASPPVRHAGTLGGNVANGSPIGDGAPVLMALDATLLLRRADGLRELPLADFYTGYQRNRLAPGEFLQALRVPLPASPADAAALRVHKISKRFDSDISAVCAALRLALDDAGTVTQARLAFGGMAATVQRAAHAEAALVGRAWDEAALQAAGAALAQDFTPLSDLRASAGYRLQVARNLLRRHWLQTRRHDPLPALATSVFARGVAA